MSNFKISTKYLGIHIRIVYNPQSTVKLAIITAQTGREVIIEHHGTFSFYKRKSFTQKVYQSWEQNIKTCALYHNVCHHILFHFFKAKPTLNLDEFRLPWFCFCRFLSKCTLFLPRRLSDDLQESDEQ